jgi:hypothetical protein
LEKLALVLKHLRADAGNTLLAVAKLQLGHQNLMRQLRMDCFKSKPGSIVRLHYLRALGREAREHAAMLMDFGYHSRNLGLTTELHYEFKSYVGLGGDTKVMDVRNAPFAQADFPADRRLGE